MRPADSRCSLEHGGQDGGVDRNCFKARGKSLLLSRWRGEHELGECCAARASIQSEEECMSDPVHSDTRHALAGDAVRPEPHSEADWELVQVGACGNDYANRPAPPTALFSIEGVVPEQLEARETTPGNDV